MNHVAFKRDTVVTFTYRPLLDFLGIQLKGQIYKIISHCMYNC